MAGISEQLADAIFDALTVAAPGGAGVHRARQDVIGIEECPAVVVSTPTESAEPASLDGSAVRVEVQIDVALHVAAGDPWETAADAVAVPAWAAILGATLPGGAVVQSMYTQDDAQAGDGSPGVRVLVFTFVYYRQTAALDAVPA